MECPDPLSVVIPAYNEARRLGRSIQSIESYAAHRPQMRIELIIVDDGSTDGTAELARGHSGATLEVRVLVNERNRGKGYSVRRGMLEARGQALLMCDADMSTPIEQVDKLLPHLGAEVGVVIGSRDVAGAVLDPPQGPVRRFIHWSFGVVRRRILLPDIRDSQCGFKLFTRPAAQEIFAREITDGYAFDCEVLGLARAMGHGIREVGVVWRNDPDSAVHLFRAAPTMLRDLLRIRRRLNREFGTHATAQRR